MQIILKIDYNSFTIEKFLVKNRIYQTLSDHFGLSIDLIYSPNQNLSIYCINNNFYFKKNID